MSNQEFLKMLQAHDWYYGYSDDHGAWRKGQQQWQRISAALKAHPELRETFDTYKKERNL